MIGELSKGTVLAIEKARKRIRAENFVTERRKKQDGI